MRLLQIQHGGKFSLVEREGDDPYAILSHTWGLSDEEVSFQDLRNGTGENKKGYRKLVFCGKQADLDGFKYFWVDTCCIDKTSSAELSEAINSMYQWYQAAEKCYAYLEDVPSKETFPNSKWFTRGWTLQELIAPAEVAFFNERWEPLGTKADLSQVLSECTKIPTEVLLDRNVLDTLSIAQKMSWAACRKTSRDEDRAYCMMGLFEINMPLIYGEGMNAFIRLQEEILKISDDHSLFAWQSSDHRGGCLATSPASFLNSSNIVQSDISDEFRDPATVSSRGVHLELRFMGSGLGRLGFAILDCCERGNEDEPIAIHIRDLSLTMKHFERVRSNDFAKVKLHVLDPSRYPVRRICIRKGRTTRRSDAPGVLHSTLSTDINLERSPEASTTIELSKELINAVKDGFEDKVWLLLTRTDIRSSMKDGTGRSALSYAASCGHEGIVSMLLDRNDALVNSEDNTKRTPLSWAAAHGHVKSVKLLLHNAKVSVDTKDKQDRTPLSWAAANGHEAVVELLLSTQKVDINAKDRSGRAPISWAAAEDHNVIVNSLLKTSRVDFNANADKENSFLKWATRNRDERVAELLLNTGRVNAPVQRDQTLLSWAAREGHEMLVRLLLRTEGINVNLRPTEGQTPLSSAALNGHEEVVKLLLSVRGVDVNAMDWKGLTPLSHATAKGHEAVVKLLLSTNKALVTNTEKKDTRSYQWRQQTDMRQ